MTGAKQPNYLVTADDVDTYLAIEVQPLDNRKRKVLSPCSCDCVTAEDISFHVPGFLRSGGKNAGAIVANFLSS